MFAAIGRHTLRYLERTSDIMGLLTLLVSARLSMAHASRRRIFYKLYKLQIFYTGVQSLYATAVVAALIGALLVFRLPILAPGQQTVAAFAELFVIIMVREIAPFMCAMIAIVRSGTAITSKIGYLKLFREFEVAQGLGINPVHLFLVPVFFAFPISLLLMLTWFLFFSMAGAAATLWLQTPGIEAALMVDDILQRIELNDIVVIVAKSIFSGILIGLYAIHYGSTMEPRLTHVARGISIATTRAMVVVLFVNVIISILAYQ